MTYHADPGGVFESDAHRRVLGHLPPDEKWALEDLAARLDPDEHTPITADEVDDLEGILLDLEAEGYVGQTKDGWKVTKSGQEALNAPVGGAE